MSFFDDVRMKVDEFFGGGVEEETGQQHIEDATQQIEEVKNTILPGDEGEK